MTRKDRLSQIEGATQGARTSRKMVSGSKGATQGGQARRTRSPHPGVVLKAPTPPRTAWRARYTDPDTEKQKYDSLDPLGAGRNAQTRKLWAVDKARAIAKRKDELASGAPRATGTDLEAAISKYFEDHPRLRPRTQSTYQLGTDKLVAWCLASGIKSADKLTLAHLMSFRSRLSVSARLRNAPGAKRGGKADTPKPRAPAAVNVEIRSVKAVLRYLRGVGLLPKLSRDDIADGLKLLASPKEAPDFLRMAQIKRLLEAAILHDSETYSATRAEHAGQGEPGSTPRYPAIKPLLLVTLLTGMRFGEVVDLQWEEVDLQEGEIRLGTRTKTKHARTISFDVSPLLAEVLEELHSPGAKGRVWPMTVEQIRAAAKRLTKSYGVPEGWSFQILRRTCGTYLTNAPNIFGASSAYQSARRLGHSVAVAERHYLGVVKVSKEAETLEAAMGLPVNFTTMSNT